eukprot:m.255293 g.255293  ORF g.255293 m.255293 type:complete len:430 (+) comp19423_c0_seq1:717-2006(+)
MTFVEYDGVFVFHDGPRSPSEQRLFEEAMARINDVISNTQMFVVPSADYAWRAWCNFELSTKLLHIACNILGLMIIALTFAYAWYSFCNYTSLFLPHMFNRSIAPFDDPLNEHYSCQRCPCRRLHLAISEAPASSWEWTAYHTDIRYDTLCLIFDPERRGNATDPQTIEGGLNSTDRGSNIGAALMCDRHALMSRNCEALNADRVACISLVIFAIISYVNFQLLFLYLLPHFKTSLTLSGDIPWRALLVPVYLTSARVAADKHKLIVKYYARLLLTLARLAIGYVVFASIIIAMEVAVLAAVLSAVAFTTVFIASSSALFVVSMEIVLGLATVAVPLFGPLLFINLIMDDDPISAGCFRALDSVTMVVIPWYHMWCWSLVEAAMNVALGLSGMCLKLASWLTDSLFQPRQNVLSHKSGLLLLYYYLLRV